MSRFLRVGVTGASGFVGAGIVGRLSADGASCVGLGRSAVDGMEHRRLALGEPVRPVLFDGLDAVVHCAWDLTETSPAAAYRRNVVGSIELLRAAVAAGVPRVVFVSSMSAYEGTRQTYGRTKLAVERFVDEIGGLNVRLGLVWGADAGGMAGALQQLVTHPVVPMLGGRSYQYTVHLDDALDAIAAATGDPGLTGTVGVANPERVPVPDLLRGMARLGGAEAGRLVPLPWRPAYAAMRTAEALHVALPVRGESLLGLVRPAPSVPRVEVWESLGVRLRPFPR